jgi:inner membrane protein
MINVEMMKKNDESSKEKEIAEENVSGQEFFERHGISLKLVAVMILALLLLIPRSFVEEMISERELRKCETYSEIAKGWGREQVVNGIVLYVPVVYETGTENVIRTVRYLHILPDELNIAGHIIPERRYKSIYEFIFYSSEVKVSGSFLLKNTDDYSAGDGVIKWEEAYLAMGISSMNGIKETVKVTYDGNELTPEQGIRITDIFKTGLSSKAGINYSEGKRINFSYDLNLNGSGALKFLPSGKETAVKIDSSWPDPNFHGSFLPSKKDISDKGFSSEWKVIDLNRSYPQNWIEGNYEIQMKESVFGVSLSYPVDDYRKISRSVKYLLLFVSLTFLMFFLSEVLSKKRIHFVQYVLVGLSLLVFFVLLLSLSEHIPFLASYIISSVSTIALIGLYSSGISKSRRFGYLITTALSVLYVFLYVLLKNQDFSLLIGSIGIFAALSITMLATRNTDWYNLKNTGGESRRDGA